MKTTVKIQGNSFVTTTKVASKSRANKIAKRFCKKFGLEAVVRTSKGLVEDSASTPSPYEVYVKHSAKGYSVVIVEPLR